MDSVPPPGRLLSVTVSADAEVLSDLTGGVPSSRLRRPVGERWPQDSRHASSLRGRRGRIILSFQCHPWNRHFPQAPWFLPVKKARWRPRSGFRQAPCPRAPAPPPRPPRSLSETVSSRWPLRCNPTRLSWNPSCASIHPASSPGCAAAIRQGTSLCVLRDRPPTATFARELTSRLSPLQSHR